MKRIEKVFKAIAMEMLANGHQTIGGTSYYRHPNPIVVSKVTMQHSNVYEDGNGYFEGFHGELTDETRMTELAQELKRRWLRGGFKMGHDSWGEYRRIWADPYSIKNGVRRWLKETKVSL